MESQPAPGAPVRASRPIVFRIAALYAMLVTLAAFCWAVTLERAGAYPRLLVLGGLCFVLGLKHAMDVDHIAAIDNVTRKLVNDGKRPVAVGFFFSLGHSFIVLVMAVALVAAQILLKKDLMKYSSAVDIAGSSLCAFVLYLLAAMNIPVLLDALVSYRGLRRGGIPPESVDQALDGNGFMNRYFRWFYRSIRHSWQMFPVGVLFGLGFDTATEMVVLSTSATAAASNTLPLSLALVALMLFFSGMMLLDTTDSIVMLFAYRWAFQNPKRKVLYNLLMTGLSILIAFGIGTVEWLQVVALAAGLKGGAWTFLDHLNFSALGVGAALGLALIWLMSMMFQRGDRQLPPPAFP